MNLELSPELTLMMSHMETLIIETPGDGYRYVRVQGRLIDSYVEGGWETIAEWYGYFRSRAV